MLLLNSRCYPVPRSCDVSPQLCDSPSAAIIVEENTLPRLAVRVTDSVSRREFLDVVNYSRYDDDAAI